MGDRGSRQARRPRVELVAVDNREREVIQTDTRLVEAVTRRAAMLGQAQPDPEPPVAEEHLAPGAVRCLVAARPFEAEHPLVPRRARVDVTHGQSEVMDAVDHGDPVMVSTVLFVV